MPVFLQTHFALLTFDFFYQAKLEAQYVSKREAATKEISDLKQQLDLKTQENRNLSVTVESLKGANEALKVVQFSFLC